MKLLISLRSSSSNKLLLPFICVFNLLLINTANSQVVLPRLVSDGMILQRDIDVKLWGWASPSEKVILVFKNKQYTTIADDKGNWIIKLPAQKSGGPYTMNFAGKNNITISNILFGDVWVCSGQSNMELPMERVRDKYASIIRYANNPFIRQFEVPDKFDFEKPCRDVASGNWVSVTPINILKFSAVAYFFAADLYSKYRIPIGLINSALGGSPAESWISEESLKKFPGYYDEAQKFKDKNLVSQVETKDRAVSNRWYKLLDSTDNGIRNNWSDPEINDADWQTMNVPGYWADGALGNINGAVWFRKTINLPESMLNAPAKLLLGRIVDADIVYINGKKVGTTSYQYPPRRYETEPGILKQGENVIAVRVISNSGKGGFVLDKPYVLVVGTDSIDLRGNWKYKLGTRMDALPGQTFIAWKPLGLYNAMIAPLTNYSIKGVIWYQGEANTKKPSEYTALMQTLITDWRAQWKQGDFPFLLVQLANFMEPRQSPSESSWAELRQAQLNTAQSVANTGMAVAIDAGEWNDIHPLDKKDVGERLALWAEHLTYGNKNIVYAGPICKNVNVENGKMIITFSNCGSGLYSKGNNELKYFSIAGADKKFVWANTKIIGKDKIMLWSDAVDKPVTVRYAWADNPEGANLYNKENLPASPFEISTSN